MSNNQTLPSIQALKAQAKRLRQSLAASPHPLTHSAALELLATQHGYRNWNTLQAAASRQPGRLLQVGGPVSGKYLGHAFTARLLGLQALNNGERHQVTLDLDRAIDVVKSEHFSAFRKRISGTIDQDGRSSAKTSDGQPVLALDL